MRYCKKCGNKIPRKAVQHGVEKKLKKSRKLCLNCSPYKGKRRPHSSSSSEDKKSHGVDPSIDRSKSGWRRRERRKRKEALVKMLGGQCAQCGYNKSLRALSFHHKVPSKKEFDISKNGALLRKWALVKKEVRKCQLLCLNCHAELHNGN